MKKDSKGSQNELFSTRLQRCLHSNGYTQKALATAIGLHPQVLGRKLNGSNNAYLTHVEVRNIVITLARWHAITTQDEAFQLLEAAQVKPSLFCAEEWQTPPLSMLAARNTRVQLPSVPLEPPAIVQHNLPALTTRLVGREKVATQLLELAGRETVRLVTLRGPGGCGKTRLVLQVARDLLNAFAQGVWFVPLADVGDPELVPMHILNALDGAPAPAQYPLRALTSYLQNKQLLLILDNCEQLQSSAMTHLVSEMLASAPHLKIFATSRVRLHLYGEYEFSVPPLDFPFPPASPDKEEFAQYSAIQLFLERTQPFLPDFTLTNENAALVAQICARVDGLPLLLELAAARVKVLPLPVLLEKLSYARLHVLTDGARDMPARQQTLRNTLNWSYDLLSLSEQKYFRWLGIFAGGCSLEAVEMLLQFFFQDEEQTAVSEYPLNLLERLVNSSLLSRATTVDNQVRFVMLEIHREYALEKLCTNNEVEMLQDWHACYYLKCAEVAKMHLEKQQPLEYLLQLKADLDNLRQAAEWTYQKARCGIGIRAFPFLLPTKESPEDRIMLSQGETNSELDANEIHLRLTTALQLFEEWRNKVQRASDDSSEN